MSAELRVHSGLSYRLDGTGSRAILFLHPAFADGRCFDEQVAALRDDYRTLAVDLPGHGRTAETGPRATPPPTMGRATELIAAVLETEGIDGAHVVGVSMGSLIAQDLARRFPDRVHSLTVLGGYEVTDRTMARANSRALLGLLPLLLFRMDRWRRHVTEQSVYTDRGRRRYAELVAGFRRRDFRAMQGMGEVVAADRTDALRCPLLILVGEHDQAIVRAAAERWHAATASSQLSVLEGAGHCANLDDPTGFNGRLRAFLAEVG